MKLKNIGLIAIILGLTAASGLGAESTAKPVMAYYMPWFAAKPYRAEWGWHWTMDHFEPEVVQASGERQLASWYYPLIGPYDSSEPVVLEYHVLLMKLAGLNGVMVDWYGMDDFLDYGVNNRNALALLQFTRKAGLKFALCYEDQTIAREIDGGFIKAGDALAHAQETMLYAQTNFFTEPSYLRWSNRPVLLNFGPQFFKTNFQWEAIFSVLAPGNRPSFFTEDHRLPVGDGAFDWPPMWLSQAPGTGGVLSVAALESYLSTFQQNGKLWPAYISSAFPRFHDIYQKAGVRDYWGYLGDRNGETLRQTLKRALTDGSAFAQVVTWNDFGEGTMVEPTREYGYRDLGILQDFRRQYLDPGFSYHTNELTLAARLFRLRGQRAGERNAQERLDLVFTNIVSGDLGRARAELTSLEAAKKD